MVVIIQFFLLMIIHEFGMLEILLSYNHITNWGFGRVVKQWSTQLLAKMMKGGIHALNSSIDKSKENL